MRGPAPEGCCARSAREAPPRPAPASERPPAALGPSGTPRGSPAAAAPPAPGRAMSKVRVSSGSPPLERAEGRPAEAPKPSACRCLFGAVDHPGLAREWRAQSRQLEEAGRRRWNFDFRRGQPLEGRFEWRALDRAALPDFYSRPPRLASARQPDGPRRRPQPGADDRSPPGALRCAQGEAPEPEPRQEPQQDGAAAARGSAGPRKRPAAEDSSPQSKRANTAEELSEDPLEDPLVANSEEQTPKKKKKKKQQPSPKQCQT